MKKIVQFCLLFAIMFLIVAIYSYVYETSSTGMLPYIDYPLRSYSLPFVIIGFISLALAFVFNARREIK
jgi:hypothetical protein